MATDDQTIPSEFQIRLLGPVDVVDGSGSRWAPATPLRRTLLSLLALEAGTIVDADRLLDLAWDANPPASGRRALRFHISKLRDELPDGLIETQPGGYRLNAATDIQQVEHIADPDEALGLWRGTPLVDIGPCAILEHEQQRLGEQHLTFTEHRFQQLLSYGKAASVIGDLTRLCLDHPVRESLWALLITAHYKIGNQADALRSYDQLRHNLIEQLGVDPSPDVQQLHQHILEQHADLARHMPLGDVGAESTQRVPTGTVTFLFTDIENSTHLWEAHTKEMRGSLERHDQIIRTATTEHGGYVFSTAGGSFAVAFPSAEQAVAAAERAQTALEAEQWASGVPIRVRMGLHTGEAQERDGDYFGPAVNRAARIMAAGHGGQVLLSSVSSELTSFHGLTDLGEHHLKDLAAVEHLWQIGDVSFPTLRTLTTARHNLPVQRTPLISRVAELVRASDMLDQSRLVTLVGIGGMGKTKLALSVASQLVERFPAGVFLVELAQVREESNIVTKVAEAAGLSILGAQPGDDLTQHVVSLLGDRRLLLVMDNCEHLIDGTAQFIDRLLDAGEQCRVLATSRERLELEGEQVLSVPQLSPEAGLELLVSSARAADDGFDPSNDVEALEQVCESLDGIPLAIELASAQLDQLSPRDLVAGLGKRFDLLAGGRRRGRQKQQTLVAMMDWSWSLLTPIEQHVLAAVSVFLGGFNAEAAAQVHGGVDGAWILPQLRNLHAKSLLSTSDHSPGLRFDVLETVRIYAAQKLLETGTAEETRDRHLDWALDFADQLSSGIHTDQEVEWAIRTDVEMANLTTAAEWGLVQGDTDRLIRLFQLLEPEFFLRSRPELASSALALVEQLHAADDDRLGIAVAICWRLGISGPFSPAELFQRFEAVDWNHVVARYPMARLFRSAVAARNEAVDWIAPLPDELRTAGSNGEAARLECVVASLMSHAGLPEAQTLIVSAIESCMKHAGQGSQAIAHSFAAGVVTDKSQRLKHALEAIRLGEQSRALMATRMATNHALTLNAEDQRISDQELLSQIANFLDSLQDAVSPATYWTGSLSASLALASRRRYDGVIETWAAISEIEAPGPLLKNWRQLIPAAEERSMSVLGKAEIEARQAIGRHRGPAETLANLLAEVRGQLAAAQSETLGPHHDALGPQ